MNSCFYKFPLLLTAFFFPLLLMALEKIELPIGLRYRISAASMATLQNCRQITLFSEKHKYYFVFSTAYDLGQDKSKEFDHIFIFRNDLNERSLVFYWEPYFNFVQIQQLLDNNFHQDIPADKFRWFSGIAISEKAAVAGYFLKEKFFISTVHLHSNVNLRPVNGETQVIKPEFSDTILPVELAMPFDWPELAGEAKKMQQEKLSEKSVKQVDDGYLIQTLKNKFYYICENADGIYLAAFVNGKMVINGRFTHDKVISQLIIPQRFGKDKLVQVFSSFEPFECKIFYHSPEHTPPLFVDVRNDDCTREIFTVKSVKK